MPPKEHHGSEKCEGEKELEDRDRERKAQKTNTQSDEVKAKERKANAERMAKKRADMSKEQKELIKAKDRERKAIKQLEQSDVEKDQQRHANKDRMTKKRTEMSNEEKEVVKAKDRERKALKKLELSADEKDKQRQSNKERMAKQLFAMSDAQYEAFKVKDRERKEKVTDKYVNDDWLIHMKEYNRLYNIKMRENQSNASHEFEMINNLLCMRRLRNSRDGKEHLLDNRQAKLGMQLMKEERPLKPFMKRNYRDIDECELWTWFMCRGKEFAEILKKRKPEMATKVAEIIEIRKKMEAERKAKDKEIEDKGYWRMNPADESYYWTGINPPGPDNPHPDEMEPEPLYSKPMSKEEMRMLDKQIDEMYSQWYRQLEAENREERNRKAREYYHKRKAETDAELMKPIEVPEFELSEYEKIREQNIKERNEALEAAGFSKM